MLKKVAAPTVTINQRIQSIVAAELTSIFAIAIAIGMPEDEAKRLVAGEIEPTDEQRNLLESLLAEYTRAVKVVNAEVMRSRM